MDYTREFRKFINGQYLNSGIRLTASVIIPSLLLYHFNLLASFISVPLGAMCVGLTDNPGPFHHRKNSLAGAVTINFFVALVSGFLNPYPFFLIAEIIVFGMLFSLIGVYGNRISSIGTLALYVFVFGIDSHFHGINILYNALWFTAGGLWYLVLALSLYRLNPYKIIRQLLGEKLAEISRFLQLKADFYLPHENENDLRDQLMKSQVAIQQYQEELREIIFKTRMFVKESNVKSRTLLIMFLNSIDFFERIFTSQPDYRQLHAAFDSAAILQQYYSCINVLADELHKTALAVQAEENFTSQESINDAISAVKKAYSEFRKNNLNSENIESFIKLKNILDTLEDIAAGIKQLQLFTAYDKKINRKFKQDVDVSLFVAHNEIDPHLLMENLNFKSNNFRHALRVTLALLAGYLTSLFFPLGHGYWILLTITTIIKPAYSITKQRNFQRLSGTVAGAAIGFAALYFMPDKTVLFLIMLLAMIVAYSFFRLDYFVCSTGITVYVLLAFYFLTPHSFQSVLSDRVIDTAIGSFIAFVVSITVFPNWEHEKSGEYILHALNANRRYFAAAAVLFLDKIYDANNFKLARKDAFIALANLSGHFQRMLSEPKSRQPHLEEYHQFAVTSQLLTSYIASFAYYSQTIAKELSAIGFEPVIAGIESKFSQVLHTQQFDTELSTGEKHEQENIKEKLEGLLTLRSKEIAENRMDEITETRKNLLPLQTISSQLELIETVVSDEIKILQKIFPVKNL